MTLSTVGVRGGIALTYGMLFAAQTMLERRFGIFVTPGFLTETEIAILAGIVASALLPGVLPALLAYRNTLTDELRIRV